MRIISDFEHQQLYEQYKAREQVLVDFLSTCIGWRGMLWWSPDHDSYAIEILSSDLDTFYYSEYVKLDDPLLYQLLSQYRSKYNMQNSTSSSYFCQFHDWYINRNTRVEK